jgi:hypothetical protein
MRKFFLIILVIMLMPFMVMAESAYNVTTDHPYLETARLGAIIPVHVAITGGTDALRQIKMVAMSIQDNRPGKGYYHIQEDKMLPSADDYADGRIEGTVGYQTYADINDVQQTGRGWHNIKIFLCKTDDRTNCARESGSNNWIATVQVDNVVYIGDTPPSSAPPTSPGGGTTTTSSDPGGGSLGGDDPLLPGQGQFPTVWDLILRVVNILLAFAGLVAMGAIIVGGYQYITAGGIPDRVQIAKMTLTYAIVGLIIVVAVFAALQFVFRILGVNIGIIWFG